MKVLILTLGLIFTFSTLSANEDAAIANYKKTCKQCHGSAYYVAKVRMEDEWNDLFNNNAKKLYAAHINDEKAIKKLESNYFRKRMKDLQVFLAENANDMGTVPPCNSTTCGFSVKLLKKDKDDKPKPSLFKKAQ